MSSLDGIAIVARGLLLGFAIAAPVGPIGVLCIRRTLAEGRLVGFVTGLGAATADACYGLIAGLGLALAPLLVGHRDSITLIGGLFLCYLGARTMVAQPAERAASLSSSGLARAYLSTLVLTLSNPATVLSFVALFASVGVAQRKGGAIALLVLGVFVGSALWWLVLSGTVGLLRGRLTRAMLVWVNRVSGAIVCVFGLVALVGLWR